LQKENLTNEVLNIRNSMKYECLKGTLDHRF
jgi:hypothetical protein